MNFDSSISVVIPTLKKTVTLPPHVVSSVDEVILNHRVNRSVARNRGAQQAHGTYLLFLDDDVWFDVNVFNDTILPAAKTERVVSCSGNAVLCTRVLGIPKPLFFALGGFDETFDVGEDMEFGLKLWSVGWQIHRIPRGKVNHRDHDTLAPTLRKKIHCANRVRFMLRYHVCLIQNRIQQVSVTDCVRMFVQAHHIGIGNVTNAVLSLFAFCYYLFNNQEKRVRVR